MKAASPQSAWSKEFPSPAELTVRSILSLPVRSISTGMALSPSFMMGERKSSWPSTTMRNWMEALPLLWALSSTPTQALKRSEPFLRSMMKEKFAWEPRPFANS